MEQRKMIRFLTIFLILVFSSTAANAQFGLFKKRDKGAAAEEEVVSDALKESLAFLAANAQAEGVQVTPSGLQYQVVASGGDYGRTPFRADIVRVRYEGRFIDGTVFDSKMDPNYMVEFNVSELIPGWKEALGMMKEGDAWRLFIPPDLAYGEKGQGDRIPPDQALIFDIELVEVIRTGLAQ
ncbi:MAG: hypothetical protein Tsb0010_10730 [Parvularculaceae bacterium]